MADEIALELGGVRVRWDAGAVAAYPSADPKPAWALEGSLTPAHSALRVLSGATSDGSILLLAAARPAAADAHDAELIGAVVVEGGNAVAMDEVLLSTEYAGDGTIRRITLELYREGDDYPIRGAGDAKSTGTEEREGHHTESATLHFRLDGSEGAALYEIVQ
ncbi:MAG TPA: hypothetical protein VD766_01935 [Solirubrobacterales bacterium]|nr:hypothetical protein [Solirubrobacterales bacterium]